MSAFLFTRAVLYKKFIKRIAPAGFEPASPAPKAGRIDHYPTGLPKKFMFRFIKVLVKSR